MVKSLKWESPKGKPPTIREVPQKKVNGYKEVKESLGNSHSYRVDVDFFRLLYKILACLGVRLTSK